MEKKEIKRLAEKYCKPLICLRFFLIYQLFLIIAKYSYVFDKGMIPGDLLTIFIVGALMMYRFICVTFVPGIMTLWIIEFMYKNKTKINKSKPGIL
jgi:hypothetical protein